MGLLTHLFYPWGLLLQAAAIIHFIRRRPETYWLYVILFLGPVGALVYIFAEVVPDFTLLNQSLKGISRRKRIAALELMIRDNPSAGNYEELGELLMEDGKLGRAGANISEADAEIAFVVAKNGVGAGQRLENRVVNVHARAIRPRHGRGSAGRCR